MKKLLLSCMAAVKPVIIFYHSECPLANKSNYQSVTIPIDHYNHPGIRKRGNFSIRKADNGKLTAIENLGTIKFNFLALRGIALAQCASGG